MYMMGNVCCFAKRRCMREESNQVMPDEEYEYTTFFLGDIEDGHEIFIYKDL